MIHPTHRPLSRVHSLARVRLLRALLPVLCVAGLGATRVHAQPAEKLPKGEAVLDKYVEVTGGKAAYDKLNNRVTKATFEIPAQGLKLAVTSYAARPNKVYTLMESEALGKIEKGTDGAVAWELNVMTGPQIKEGEERALFLREATFNASTEWRRLYKQVECVGLETIDDHQCYKVVLTPPEGEGAPETRYYDKESGLAVKVEMSVTLPMGTIPFESYIGDYRRVDGILLPHKVRVLVLGTERIVMTESVAHNVELPKDRFKLPEDVQVLVDKQKSEKAEASGKEQQKGREAGKTDKP